MTVNATLTVERHSQYAKEYAVKKVGYSETDHFGLAAFSQGWTESAFASLINNIEAKYGEDALLKLLDNINMSPVYSSAV